MPMIIWFIFWWVAGFPELHLWDIELWTAWTAAGVICFLWTIFD